jgi:hypothetical protein
VAKSLLFLSKQALDELRLRYRVTLRKTLEDQFGPKIENQLEALFVAFRVIQVLFPIAALSLRVCQGELQASLVTR